MTDKVQTELTALAGLNKVKIQLSKRAGSLSKLGRTFVLNDKDKNGQLSLHEFETMLQHAGCSLSKVETKALFGLFDYDKSGSISYEEFMCRLRDPLEPRRLAMVKRCFDVMDADGSGQIDSKDLKGIFNCSENPDVISGRKTEAQVFK